MSRRGRRARRLGAALALALLAAPAAAQNPEAFLVPCRREDLVGVWRVMRFGFATNAGVDRNDPAYQGHQRYVFHTNATMIYVASPMPIPVEQERALASAPGTEIWAVEPSGRLVRQAPGAPRVTASECRVVTQPVQDPRGSQPTAQPGDLLLTDRDADDRPTVRRLLRRVHSAE